MIRVFKIGDRVKIKETTKQQLLNWKYNKLLPHTLENLKNEIYIIAHIDNDGAHLYHLKGMECEIFGNIWQIGFSFWDFEESNTCNCPLTVILTKGCGIHE